MTKNLAFVKSLRAQLALRGLGGVVLLFVGLDHLYEYSVGGYSAIPTIGLLFLLNFVSASVIALLLLTPVDRLLRRSGAVVVQFAALSGFALAATSLIALLVSEQTPLFGFREYGYRQAIVVSIVVEVATTLLLGAFLLGLVRSSPMRFRLAHRAMR
jgi:hypothetical protein